jgi:hypothetical protein
VRISRAKYDLVRGAILDSLGDGSELTLEQLNRQVEQRLAGRFDGSIPWYVVTVKLDLEARRVIERRAGKPHRVHIRK